MKGTIYGNGCQGVGKLKKVGNDCITILPVNGHITILTAPNFNLVLS
jgi:hypothetical protein